MPDSSLKGLLNKELTRKQFLKVGTLGAISVVGIAGIIKEIHPHSRTTVAKLTDVAGITVPAYAPTASDAPGATYSSAANALAALNKSYGMNWVAVQTSYSTRNWNGTDVTAHVDNGTLSDSAIVAQIVAAKAHGLKVMLKPHCTPADGSPQRFSMPGAQYSIASYGSESGLASYGTSSPIIAAPRSLLHLTTKNVGDRVVLVGSPYINNYADIPGSAYATKDATGGDPTNSLVHSVVNSTSFALGNTSGAAINPVGECKLSGVDRSNQRHRGRKMVCEVGRNSSSSAVGRS